MTEHHLHKYKCYSNTVVGKLLCYTLLQDCNRDRTWHIATVQLFYFSAVYNLTLLQDCIHDRTWHIATVQLF